MRMYQGEFDFGIPEPPWRPKQPERVFYALFLQQKDYSRFADCQSRLCGQCEITGSRLLYHRFHVSLQHVGDYKRLREKIIFAAARSGRRIVMSEFEVTFRHFRSFPGRPATRGRPAKHPFVLLADDGPVCELSRKLGVEMLREGLKASNGFVPHLTLAYDQKIIPQQPVGPISFIARQFVLVHSLRGLKKYVFPECWPLNAM
ncbi:2'-5' RNA ligase family protein [Mesorhizobium comanense]|uniref:2'-5' RNA ligase family protein n=1 Tax=Mesorhizobium comanense TaxID=2502215 RepID=UPI001E2D314B|nr:2'-5' RNA ligase family protein [Mesorhizobium comanense]